MASFWKDFYTYVNADSAILAIVGDGIYTEQAPTKAQEPYYVMFTVDDPENGQMLCYDMEGQMRVQFSLYTRSKNDREDMDGLKLLIRQIYGNITADYNIWQNQTEGVKFLGESEGIFHFSFDSIIGWTKIT